MCHASVQEKCSPRVSCYIAKELFTTCVMLHCQRTLHNVCHATLPKNSSPSVSCYITRELFTMCHATLPENSSQRVSCYIARELFTICVMLHCQRTLHHVCHASLQENSSPRVSWYTARKLGETKLNEPKTRNWKDGISPSQWSMQSHILTYSRL